MQTEIPEDVMKAAIEAYEEARCLDDGQEYEVIARAIMAERDRCAQLCDAERQRRLESNYPAVRRHDFMAVAIRLTDQIKRGEIPAKQEGDE